MWLVWSVFSVLILTNPVAFAQAISLLSSFGWMNLAALVIVVAGGFVINVILTHIHDGQVWKQIVDRYFRDFGDCKFEPVDLELEQPLLKLGAILRRPEYALRYSGISLGAQAFYVQPTGVILPSTLTTYQMGGGTTFIFLTQKPEKMGSVARFYLLHEMGHATLLNQIIKYDWFAMVHFCLLFIFIAFHRQSGILTLLITLGVAAIWGNHLEQRDNPDKRVRLEEAIEILADTFAITHLAARPDFRKAVAWLACHFRKKGERHRARLLVERAQILSRTGVEDSSWVEHVVVPAPFWLSTLILAGVIWLGVRVSIEHIEELSALSLVWVVVPTLWYYYYMFLRRERPRTSRYRRQALKFLRAHAPEGLPEKRQIDLMDLV